MRKDTKLFLFYVEKYIILTGKSIFKKKKKEISCRIGVNLESLNEKNVATRQITLPSRTSHTYTNRD